MLEFERKLKLLKLASVLVILHLIMGVCQERILKQPYVRTDTYFERSNAIANCSDDVESMHTCYEWKEVKVELKESFTYTLIYVGVQCFNSALVAKGAIAFYQHESNETPQKYFILQAIFYVCATVTGNLSLQWVAYTTQVVTKSSKPIAVMILSVLIARKSYRLQMYVFVVVLVLALILFMYDIDTIAKHDQHIGTALIGVSLLMDGLMSAVQDRMRSTSKVTSLNLMYFLNLWSSLYLAALIFVKDEFMAFLDFCTRHPTVILHLGILVVVSTSGHFLVSRMIKNFGALPLSIVMTIRKFLTVFLSVLIYDNKMSVRKWIATGIIFMTLIVNSIYQESKDDLGETIEVNNNGINGSETSEKVNLSRVIIEGEFDDAFVSKQVQEHECIKCEEKR